MIEMINGHVVPQEPIKIFKNKKQLQTCLRYWRKILYLDDWCIAVKLIDEPIEREHVGGSVKLAGNNHMSFEQKVSYIEILNKDPDEDTAILRLCAEQVLVHELLHCLYSFVGTHKPSYEEAYFDTLEHTQLEMMSRSLVMAKYHLTPDYFDVGGWR
jgi:hypothetical protein